MYAMFCIIEATCSVFGITQGQVLIGCDNDQGVRNSELRSCKVMQKQWDVDLVRAIRKVKKSIPVKFRFINVKGHMDDE